MAIFIFKYPLIIYLYLNIKLFIYDKKYLIMTETSNIFDNALYTDDDNLDILGDNISSQVEDVILGANGACGVSDYQIMPGPTTCLNGDSATTCGRFDAGFECPAVQTAPTACTLDVNACMFVSGTCVQYNPLTPTTAKFTYSFNYYPIRLTGVPSHLTKCHMPYKIDGDFFVNKNGYNILSPYFNYECSGIPNNSLKIDYLHNVEDNKWVVIDYVNRGGNSKLPLKDRETFKFLISGHLPNSGITVSAYTFNISLASGETLEQSDLTQRIINHTKTQSASTDVSMNTISYTISGASITTVPNGIKYGGLRFNIYEQAKLNFNGYNEENENIENELKNSGKYNKIIYNQFNLTTYSTDSGKTSILNLSNLYNTKTIYNPYRYIVIQPTRAGYDFSPITLDTWGINNSLVTVSGRAFTNKITNWNIFSSVTATPTNELLTKHELKKMASSTNSLSGNNISPNLLINDYISSGLNTSLKTYHSMNLSGFTFDRYSSNRFMNASNMITWGISGAIMYNPNITSASTIPFNRASIYCVFEYTLPKIDIGPLSNLGQNIWYSNGIEKSGKTNANNWEDNKLNVYFMNMSSIGAWGFSEYPNLKKCYISKDITSIGDGAFYDDSNCILYYFIDHTAVPTLSSTRTFQNMNSSCKIVVPDSLYDSWKAATNWSTFASKIVKKSNYNDL